MTTFLYGLHHPHHGLFESVILTGPESSAWLKRTRRFLDQGFFLIGAQWVRSSEVQIICECFPNLDHLFDVLTSARRQIN